MSAVVAPVPAPGGAETPSDVERLACITEPALRAITAPVNMNSGGLEDIYKMRKEDFEEPRTLEIEFSDGHGGRKRDIVFVDPLHADRRPWVCVSVDGIQAMHNAIGVLSRKVDNLVKTLRDCRAAYYKEVCSLRQQLHMQAEAQIQGAEYALRDTMHFDALQYDFRSQQELEKRVNELTAELSAKLVLAHEEIKLLEKRVQAAEKETFRAQVTQGPLDPREAIPELLKKINCDTLLNLMKSAMGDEVNVFYKTIEDMLNDYHGFDMLALAKLVEEEKQKRHKVEIQLAKANDHTELMSQVEKLQKELEGERDKRIKTAASLGAKVDELQVTLSAANKAQAQMKEQKIKANLRVDELESQLEKLRKEKTKLESSVERLQAKLDQGKKGAQAAPSGIELANMPVEELVEHIQKDLNEEHQLQVASSLLEDLPAALRQEHLVNTLTTISDSDRILVSEQVASWTPRQLKSEQRSVLATAMVMGGMEPEHLEALTKIFPEESKKHVCIEVVEHFAVAEHHAELERAKQDTGNSETPVFDTRHVLDPSKDWSKWARQAVILRVLRSLSGDDIKDFVDRLSSRARRSLIQSIIDVEDPEELVLCANTITSEVGLQALSSGFQPNACERLISLLAARIGNEVAQKAVSSPATSLAAKMGQTFAKAAAAAEARRRMSTMPVRKEDFGVQVDMEGRGLSRRRSGEDLRGSSTTPTSPGVNRGSLEEATDEPGLQETSNFAQSAASSTMDGATMLKDVDLDTCFSDGKKVGSAMKQAFYMLKMALSIKPLNMQGLRTATEHLLDALPEEEEGVEKSYGPGGDEELDYGEEEDGEEEERVFDPIVSEFTPEPRVRIQDMGSQDGEGPDPSRDGQDPGSASADEGGAQSATTGTGEGGAAGPKLEPEAEPRPSPSKRASQSPSRRGGRPPEMSDRVSAVTGGSASPTSPTSPMKRRTTTGKRAEKAKKQMRDNTTQTIVGVAASSDGRSKVFTLVDQDKALRDPVERDFVQLLWGFLTTVSPGATRRYVTALTRAGSRTFDDKDKDHPSDINEENANSDQHQSMIVYSADCAPQGLFRCAKCGFVQQIEKEPEMTLLAALAEQEAAAATAEEWERLRRLAEGDTTPDEGSEHIEGRRGAISAADFSPSFGNAVGGPSSSTAAAAAAAATSPGAAGAAAGASSSVGGQGGGPGGWSEGAGAGVGGAGAPGTSPAGATASTGGSADGRDATISGTPSKSGGQAMSPLGGATPRAGGTSSAKFGMSGSRTRPEGHDMWLDGDDEMQASEPAPTRSLAGGVAASIQRKLSMQDATKVVTTTAAISSGQGRRPVRKNSNFMINPVQDPNVLRAFMANMNTDDLDGAEGGAQDGQGQQGQRDLLPTEDSIGFGLEQDSLETFPSTASLLGPSDPGYSQSLLARSQSNLLAGSSRSTGLHNISQDQVEPPGLLSPEAKAQNGRTGSANRGGRLGSREQSGHYRRHGQSDDQVSNGSYNSANGPTRSPRFVDDVASLDPFDFELEGLYASEDAPDSLAEPVASPVSPNSMRSYGRYPNKTPVKTANVDILAAQLQQLEELGYHPSDPYSRRGLTSNGGGARRPSEASLSTPGSNFQLPQLPAKKPLGAGFGSDRRQRQSLLRGRVRSAREELVINGSHTGTEVLMSPSSYPREAPGAVAAMQRGVAVSQSLSRFAAAAQAVRDNMVTDPTTARGSGHSGVRLPPMASPRELADQARALSTLKALQTARERVRGSGSVAGETPRSARRQPLPLDAPRPQLPFTSLKDLTQSALKKQQAQQFQQQQYQQQYQQQQQRQQLQQQQQQLQQQQLQQQQEEQQESQQPQQSGMRQAMLYHQQLQMEQLAQEKQQQGESEQDPNRPPGSAPSNVAGGDAQAGQSQSGHDGSRRSVQDMEGLEAGLPGSGPGQTAVHFGEYELDPSLQADEESHALPPPPLPNLPYPSLAVRAPKSLEEGILEAAPILGDDDDDIHASAASLFSQGSSGGRGPRGFGGRNSQSQPWGSAPNISGFNAGPTFGGGASGKSQLEVPNLELDGGNSQTNSSSFSPTSSRRGRTPRRAASPPPAGVLSRQALSPGVRDLIAIRQGWSDRMRSGIATAPSVKAVSAVDLSDAFLVGRLHPPESLERSPKRLRKARSMTPLRGGSKGRSRSPHRPDPPGTLRGRGIFQNSRSDGFASAEEYQPRELGPLAVQTKALLPPGRVLHGKGLHTSQHPDLSHSSTAPVVAEWAGEAQRLYARVDQARGCVAAAWPIIQSRFGSHATKSQLEKSLVEVGVSPADATLFLQAVEHCNKPRTGMDRIRGRPIQRGRTLSPTLSVTTFQASLLPGGLTHRVAAAMQRDIDAQQAANLTVAGELFLPTQYRRRQQGRTRRAPLGGFGALPRAPSKSRITRPRSSSLPRRAGDDIDLLDRNICVSHIPCGVSNRDAKTILQAHSDTA